MDQSSVVFGLIYKTKINSIDPSGRHTGKQNNMATGFLSASASWFSRLSVKNTVSSLEYDFRPKDMNSFILANTIKLHSERLLPKYSLNNGVQGNPVLHILTNNKF